MKTQILLAAASIFAISFSTTVFAHGDCGGESSGSHAEGVVNDAVVKADGLELSNGHARAMLPGQKVGGGYITIKNTSDKTEKLISASSVASSRMEIHEMAMDNGVMKMRKLADGIAIPAGGSISLAPGGNHMMFFGVEKPFVEGDMIPVEFKFEHAGTVKVDLKTTPASASKEKKHH
jgi:copper(I)-binding protein